MRILDAAIEAGAQAVDVEIESAETCVDRLESLRGQATCCSPITTTTARRRSIRCCGA